MAPTFHHFTSLPLELRQRIWELTIQPRRVPVGDFSYSSYSPAPPPPPVPPPGALQACVESRSHLARYYVKAFVTESPPRYTWINFDIDTIFMRERTIKQFEAERRSVRHLSVEVNDGDHFFYYVGWPTEASYPLLENLEIRPSDAGNDGWTREWDQMMHGYYYNDNPVRFRTTVVCLIPGTPVPELNPDNYLKVDRDLVRKIYRETPGGHWEPGYDSPWDSDEFPDRCEPGWRHAPGCDCPSSDRWAPRFI